MAINTRDDILKRSAGSCFFYPSGAQYREKAEDASRAQWFPTWEHQVAHALADHECLCSKCAGHDRRTGLVTGIVPRIFSWRRQHWDRVCADLRYKTRRMSTKSSRGKLQGDISRVGDSFAVETCQREIKPFILISRRYYNYLIVRRGTCQESSRSPSFLLGRARSSVNHGCQGSFPSAPLRHPLSLTLWLLLVVWQTKPTWLFLDGIYS